MAFKNAPKAYLSGYTVGTDDIDALAVKGAAMSAGAVIASKIASTAVTAAKISNLTITGAKLSAGCIIDTKISAGAVTDTKLGATAIKAAAISNLTITGAKISAGAITNAKLTNPNSIIVLRAYQATPVAASNVIGFQTYGACIIKEIGVSMTANGTASSTSIDVLRGANASLMTTVFGSAAKLIMKKASFIKVAAPSGVGLLAAVPDNGFIRLNVNTVASGTKSDLNAWIVLTQALTA